MARKRAKKEESKQQKPAKINPLMEVEGKFFQELVNSSNNYAALLKQKAQYEFVVKKLSEDRKKIQDGIIKMPMIVTVIPKVLSYTEHDKKVVLKMLDEHIESYKTSLKSLTGQLELRYENFIESAARNKEFLAKRFKDAVPKQIVPLRDVSSKDEETLFEADFEELLKSEKKQKEFQEAKKKAVKANVKRSTKGKK